LQCAEFEKLADALLESNISMLDKYCTLPGKRPPVSKIQPTSGRPVSTAGRSSVVCQFWSKLTTVIIVPVVIRVRVIGHYYSALLW